MVALLVQTIDRWGGGPGAPFAPTVDVPADATETLVDDAPLEPELPVLALPDVEATPLPLPDDPPPDVAEPEPPPPAPAPQAEAPGPRPMPEDRFARIRLAPRRASRATRAPAGLMPGAPPTSAALTPPRFLVPPVANFPMGAGTGTGRVVLRLHVGVDGAPTDVIVHASSGDPAFDQAARESASRWRFAAARQGDTPVPAWVEVPVRFQP